MINEFFVRSLKLKQMPKNVLQLLSCLLNPQKIILADIVDGPYRVYRDWRGLAFCIQISAELMSYIEQSEDKTAKLMAIWMQRSPQATVGELLDHLEYIDRFDVRDDVVEELILAAENGLLADSIPNVTSAPVGGPAGTSWQGHSDLLTDEDRPGSLKMYDAFVLCADEDAGFFEDMLEQMNGFDLCTPKNLRVGLLTAHTHVIKVIAKRCHLIIVVLSPAFVTSPYMQAYTDLTQALDIHTGTCRLYPIKYKPCVLPPHLYFCVTLPFDPLRRDKCWSKLKNSLTAAREGSRMQQQQSMSFDTHHSTSGASLPTQPDYNAAYYNIGRRNTPEASQHNAANYNLDNGIFFPKG